MAGKIKVDGEMFLQRINALYNNEYELISYEGSRKPATLRHLVCGTEITKRADTWSRAGCDVCRRTNPENIARALEKRKQTNLERFDAEFVMQSEEGRNRYMAAISEGEKREQFLNKIKQSNLEKYGVEWPTQTEESRDARSLYTKEELKAIIDSFSNKPSTPELLEKTNFRYPSGLRKALHRYDLWDFIDHSFSQSFPEKQIVNWLIEIAPGINIVQSDRTILGNGQEIDIYLPDYSLAIEFNGLYWHRDKDKNYHYNKSKILDEKGIRLIHIWENEWEDLQKQKILKNIILSAIGKTERIFARKCKIEVRSSISMKEFFEENNIQGFRGGKFAICLIYNGEVVMSYLMGDCFFNPSVDWEVIRGATKLGYSIVGGASKIWSYFIKEFNPESCAYYIDYNYFNGKSVANLPGFQFISSQPSFKNWWVKEQVMKNRQPKRHKEIKELIKQGLVWEIWNAGTKTYIYRR